MPSCAALGCQRRRGEPVLKIFPRKDRRRRQIWVDRVNRPGWTPSKYSALCEHHFDRDQWELPREDGKRKLKDSALPTVFKVPPTLSDGGVSREHSYCLPLFRKIYEDCNSKTDTLEQEEETMPIEHIKVEADENENFTPETVEEEEEEEEEEIEGEGVIEEELGDIEEDVESIQCTPDISVFPEQGEPFPIEVVDCENDDINAVMAEPDNDPLAISAEDQVQAATLKPYFGNSQKFLFVPKETKVVVNISSKVKGEPEVKSSESKNSPIKPTLKVKSLDGLLDPNVVLKSLSSNSASLDSKLALRSPSALYLKENLILSEKPVTSVQNLKSPAPRKKLEIDQRVVTLTSPRFSFPPTLKVTSTSTAAPPRLNLVSKKLILKKDQDFFRKTANLKVEKPFVLPHRPNILVRNPNNSKMLCLSNQKVKLIQPGLLKSDAQQILVDKNIKIAFSPGDDRNKKENIEQSGEKNKSLNSSSEGCTEFKKFFLDPQHIAEKISKQITIDGIVEEGNYSNIQIGNNAVRAWLDSNTSPDKNKNSASFLRTVLPKSLIQNKESPGTKKPSIIVLNPFGTSKFLSENTGGISLRNSFDLKMSQEQNQSITMYKCDQCQISFLSTFALQVHKHKTGHVRKESQGKRVGDEDRGKHVGDEDRGKYVGDEDRGKYVGDEDRGKHVGDEDRGKHVGDEDRRKQVNDKEDVVTVDTSESSNGFLDSESEDDDSSVIVLSENDSETDATEEISGPSGDNCSNESDSGADSSPEEGKVVNKSIIKKSVLNTFPRQFENGLTKISDISALRDSKSYEFLRLSNIVNTHRREGLLENQPSPKVNLKRQNLLNNKTKVSQKPLVLNPKTQHSKTSRNGVARFKDGSKEKELVVPSSSSSSSSSHTFSSFSRGSSSFGSGDDEISSEGDTLSDTERNPALSPSQVDVDRISELVKKKKEVEFKGELLKLSEKLEKDDRSLQSYKVKDNTRKPTVLLPRMDPMKSNNLKRASNCNIDPPGSSFEIVISDDEDLSCKQKIILDESSKKSVASFYVNIDSNKVQENIPVVANVSKEEILVDLTLTDETEMKKKALNEKPIVLLPKLKLDGSERKIIVETKHERVNVEIKNFTKSKEDKLIARVNCKSSSIQKVLSVNETYSKGKPSSNTHSTSLPPKVKAVESKTKNVVVRSNQKRSCYEKYKMAKLASQTNLKRTTRRSLKKLEGECKGGSKLNLYLKPNKTRTSVKKVNPIEEKDRNENSFEKSPGFQTRKCKLCGETVRKSHFKQHVFQHMEMTSVCKVCKKEFPHSVLLHRHMKNEHFL